MNVNANGLSTNLLVTGLVLVMVFLLPWIDRKICNKLQLNLQGGVSAHPNADALLRFRRGILVSVFVLYVAAVAWLVLFSRSATDDYQVHTALYQDLHNSVQIDYGFLGVIRAVFTEGFSAAMSHIHLVSPEDIAQVYMNIMLFVPMGYLLPYTFDWFRAKVTIRPAFACFVLSFLIENIQLVSKRGFYDVDDLVSNTLGGIIGELLFISVAYVVTHPTWKKDYKSYLRWKKNAQTRTLYPFARRMGLLRTTIRASSEEEIWDYYVMKLGFRLKKQLVPLDSPGTDMLLEMGKTQVEIHCSNANEIISEQQLTISARKLKPILKRLTRNGIDVSPIDQDPYTGLRCVHFYGPDHVWITVIEK